MTPVIETCFEEALASLDDLPDGPLRGVPWLVKDQNTLVGGMAATSGSRALRNVVAEVDSELVARHRRAGLVVQYCAHCAQPLPVSHASKKAAAVSVMLLIGLPPVGSGCWEFAAARCEVRG